MICTNCGKELEEGVIFCPSCGTKAETEPAVEKPMYGMECTQNDRTGAVQYRAPVQTGSTEAEYKAPAAEYNTPNEPAAASVKEKEYFGKGALVLCLVIIGVLAASTGFFACMYLSAIGAI